MAYSSKHPADYTHKTGVVDSDSHFTIDPKTRAIKTEATNVKPLMQYDHNSERVSFSIPRYIEKHDMLACNCVRVHFHNIEDTTREKKQGIYDVTDLHEDPNNDPDKPETQKLVFSWLISGDATGFYGSLNFAIIFECIETVIENITDENGEIKEVEKTKVTYRWNTGIYSTINIHQGMDCGDAVYKEHESALIDLTNRLTQYMNETTEIVNQYKGETDADIIEYTKNIKDDFNEHKLEVQIELDKQTNEVIPDTVNTTVANKFEEYVNEQDKIEITPTRFANPESVAFIFDEDFDPDTDSGGTSDGAIAFGLNVHNNETGGVVASESTSDTDDPKTLTTKDFVENKFVEKNKEIPYAVYGTNEPGTQEMKKYDSLASEWSIAQRGNGGRLKVGTPLFDDDAVNLDFADFNYVKRSQDSIGKTIVYGSSENKDISITASADKKSSTIAMRNTIGVLYANDPVSLADLNALVTVNFLNTKFVKKTDIATSDKLGIARWGGNFGIGVDAEGLGYINSASDADITNKTQNYKPITPSRLDMAVKVGITTNTKSLNSDEKTSAHKWLGLDDKYLNKNSGGVVDGDLSITGNLVVNGTTKTNDAETLQVKDNVIVTNSDGVEIADLSGLAIRKNADDTYGIMYDPATDSVNLGKGTYVDGNFEYTEKAGAVLVRDDSVQIQDKAILSWDSVENKLRDTGLVKGNDGTIATTEDLEDMADKLTTNTNNTLANKVSQVNLSEKNTQRIYGRTNIDGDQNDIVWVFGENPVAYAGVQRDTNGQIIVPETPSGNDRAASKLYVDNGLGDKVDKSSTPNIVYGTNYDGSQKDFSVTPTLPTTEDKTSIPRRNVYGNLEVGYADSDNDATSRIYVQHVAENLKFNRLNQDATASPTASIQTSVDNVNVFSTAPKNWSTYLIQVRFDANGNAVRTSSQICFRDNSVAGYHISAPFMYYTGTEWIQAILFTWTDNRINYELRNITDMNTKIPFAADTWLQFKELEAGV